ncbi:hypothetical protein CPB85DRAFT_1430610 [Mucidula mucida]|nr:hypothetical protein CPB85DRAFT_1430610 [Mucidula mucida]
MGQYDQSFGLSIVCCARPSDVDDGRRALLIGTWFNCMLFMLEISQAYTFFTVFHRDPPWIKCLVAFNLFVDTLGTADNCACIYLPIHTVLQAALTSLVYRRHSIRVKSKWAVPTYVILSGTSACTVQLFLAYRFWNLSKNYFISPFLFLFSLAAFAGAIANGITVVQHSTYAERSFNIKTVIIWLVASAVADIAIAVSLVFKLQSTPTTFKETKTLIHRLTFAAVQTGSVTSALAILCLILYLINTESNITVGFGFCLGRVYTLTMLFNLNTRAKGRNANLSSTEPHSTGQRENENAYSLRNMNATGISVESAFIGQLLFALITSPSIMM